MTTTTRSDRQRRPAAARRTRRLRPDLVWRSLVPLAGAVAAWGGAAAPLVGALVLGGVLLAAERLAALRRRGRLDALLVTVGASLVALVLVGLGLGATPVGLHPHTWAVALPAVSLAALATAALGPRPPLMRTARPQRAQVLRVTPWLGAGLVLVAVAVGISAHSVSATSVPPLQMSLGTVEGTTVDIVVSSGTTVGPLEIRSALQGSEVSYPLFTPEPGTPTTVPISLPAHGRYTITLSRPDQAQPLRTLVLDR